MMQEIKIFNLKECEIKIGQGLIGKESMPKGFVITDKNVAREYRELIGEDFFIIEPGEKSKSLENYEKIIRKLSESKEETVVAFGGGVVGDLAGLVASTYKRGIDLIQVPTTLLAMIDSSIGGKNGVNLGDKKNYLGTIYLPKLVLIDPEFLKTLPEKEFRNGLAEAIKYSVVFGRPSLGILQRKISKTEPDLNKIIFECCEVKVEVVRRDESDKDYRHTLNFGHTIGHAIELTCSLNHGQAISIGMIKELELGIKTGYASENKLNELKKTLIINDLPVQFPDNFDSEKTLELMRYDKKGEFVFVFDNINYNVKLNEELVRSVIK